ncbi:MAG: sialidase family protein [Planctomycetaceae bacterium]
MTYVNVEDRGVIYDATQQVPESRVAFFTGLYRLRSGVWLCGIQVGTGKHSPDSTIQVCRSDDGGTTWTRLTPNLATRVDGVPGSLSAPAIVEVATGRLLLFATWFDRSEPQRPLFDPVTQGILRSKQLLAESCDDGATWSSWRVLPTPGLSGCAGTGGIVCWPDGTFAFPFESFKEFDDPHPGNHAAWMMTSRDGGFTFSPPLLIAQHPQHQVYYWDQRLCATDRIGEFVALFWTHDLTAECDRCVHFRRAALTDSGTGELTITGEAIRETTLPGQIAAPLQLADGRLLAFVVDRRGPCTMTLWISRDDGHTWPDHERLVIHTHEEMAAVTPGGTAIDFNQYWEDMGKWSFGHPALQGLDDRRVLCAWYAGTPGCLSIHWARVLIPA